MKRLPGFGMNAEEHDRAAEKAVMRGGNFVGDRRRQRRENRIDNRRHNQAPARHGRGVARHHDVAFGNDYVDSAKGAFVDGIERRGERLVGDARSGESARIDARFSLR